MLHIYTCLQNVSNTILPHDFSNDFLDIIAASAVANQTGCLCQASLGGPESFPDDRKGCARLQLQRRLVDMVL